MEYNLFISRRADIDTINAVDYYDEINPDLGARFLSELKDTYGKIQQNPQFYSLISSKPSDKFRDLKLKSFPYVVIYEIQDKELL